MTKAGERLIAAAKEARVMVEAKVRCVNAHDRCDGGPCPYCEPVIPLRDANTGRFIAAREATHD